MDRAETQKYVQGLQAQIRDLQKHIADLESELSVKENLLKIKNGLCEKSGKCITITVDSIPKSYTHEEIEVIVNGYEKIKRCKEHEGEHLHSEEHLSILRLTSENSGLKKLNKKLRSELQANKTENDRIKKLEDRHQSDCITINQLHTALDVMTEKYQRLREMHGL